jgi:hypothetical protein
MGRDYERRLVLHGIIIVFLGLAAGFPFVTAVQSGTAENVRAWRMAHMEGVLNGLLLLAIAGVGSRLALDARKQAIAFWGLIITGYGNIIASVVGAATENRGLLPEGPAANWVVFILFTAGVVMVIVSLALVAYGARPGGSTPSTKVTVEVSDSGSRKSAPAATPRPEVDTSAAVTSVTTSSGASVDDDDDDDDDDDGGGMPLSRAQRRRAKKKGR